MNNSPNINSGWNRDGRFNRMSFIGWNTFYGLMLTLVMLVIVIMMPNTMNALMAYAENPILQGFALGFNILLLIPLMIFSARRLHDFNMSGWCAFTADPIAQYHYIYCNHTHPGYCNCQSIWRAT